MKSFFITIILFIMCLGLASSRCYARQQFGATKGSKQFQKFETMGGADQVHMLLHETSWFRKMFTLDFQHEEEILVTSSDSTINNALALEAKRNNVEQTREIVFLICQRSRFVPRTEFPIKYFAEHYSGYFDGILSPFSNFDRVGKEAAEVVTQALHSSNTKLQFTAKLYCGELEKELVSVSSDQLAVRWRTEIGKLGSGIYYESDPSERGELVRVLKRALASKGLEAAVAISLMMEKESKPWAREREVAMIAFLDAGAVRLRGSPQGREVIRVLEKTFATQEHWFVYQSKEHRQEYWLTLKRRFLGDEVLCSWTSLETLIALAFEQYYGDGGTLLAPLDKNKRQCNSKAVSALITYLTSVDPTFPSWEFPSTSSLEDMLHPKFPAKVARYHQAFVNMNKSQSLTPASESTGQIAKSAHYQITK